MSVFCQLGRVANAICSFAYISLAIRALGLRDFGILILIHSLFNDGFNHHAVTIVANDDSFRRCAFQVGR